MLRTIHHRMGFVLLAGLTLPWLVSAAQDSAGKPLTYKIDPVHTVTLFKIKHLNVSNFYGRFNKTTGTVQYNEQDPSQLALSVVVDIASLDTNNSDRDEHLSGKDYFNLSKFAKATFESTKATKTGEHTFEVTGEMTILGVSKTISASVEMTGMGDGMRGSKIIGFEATTTIKRSDFGMNSHLDALGDEVKIVCAFEASR